MKSRLELLKELPFISDHMRRDWVLSFYDAIPRMRIELLRTNIDNLCEPEEIIDTGYLETADIKDQIKKILSAIETRRLRLRVAGLSGWQDQWTMHLSYRANDKVLRNNISLSPFLIREDNDYIEYAVKDAFMQLLRAVWNL